MKPDRNELALFGGKPVRDTLLPYGRQTIGDEDIAAITNVLSSDWLTTGPKVAAFEQQFAKTVHAKEAVAVSNGTAALHAAMFALRIMPGDEVIVPAITFAASANCVVYQGGKPVFCDVDPDTLLIDPAKIPDLLTPKTKAIIAVDYAGQPCDYDRITKIADEHGLAIVDDACHALGGSYRKKAVGSLGLLNTFSFHPVKHITTGEGGMITTDDPDLAARMRLFRNHGITTDHRQREEQGSWVYEMVDLGFNYRLTDFQCALGMSQLERLPGWIARRQEIARQYDAAFDRIVGVSPLVVRPEVTHAYHLYVIRLDPVILKKQDRAFVFRALRAEGLGVNVHYIPVHLHPFYRQRFGTHAGLCPAAEKAYEMIISLPVFPRMTDADITDVITAVEKVVGNCL